MPDIDTSARDQCHPSHNLRCSDASSFDFVCTVCGRTDRSGCGWADLNLPCSTAALSAIRPGDEVPAGVVVPREMTREILGRASGMAYELSDHRVDIKPTDMGIAFACMLSAIKGGEHE